MLIGPIVLNSLLWLAWRVWWVGARLAFSRDARHLVRQETWPQFLRHWLPVHGGFWAMFVSAALGERHSYGLREVIGLLVTATGLLLAVVSRRSLGRQWSGAVTIFERQVLITGGPYEYVRHPIYSGLLLAACGSALAIGTWTADTGLLAMLVGFTIKLRREERFMADQFGLIYRLYRVGTYRLVPFVF